MSVHEALGLGLSVAPLIVQLLKVNPEPVHAVKSLNSKHVKEVMDEFYNDLSYEVVMLKITLTTLVQELPISEVEKGKLTNEETLDPMVWKKPSPELQLALERRLSPCWELFVRSMEKVLKLLAKIVDDKGLSFPISENQIRVCTAMPYSRLEEFLDAPLAITKRLRFGWTKEKREKVLLELQKHNERLTKILKRSSPISTGFMPSLRKSATGFIPDLGLRQAMSSLRRSIGRAWCKCVGKHEVRLGLSKTWKEKNELTLDMLLNVSKDDEKFHWGESKINIRLKENKSPSLPDTDSASRRRNSAAEKRRRSSNLTGTTLFESPMNSPPKDLLERKLRHPSISSVNEQSWELIRALRRPSESHREVEDLCRTVQKGQGARRASQLTFHEDLLWHDGTIIDSEVPHTHWTKPGKSLDKLLGVMSMKDRKILQVLLAQSVLFFPWTGQDLNKTTIALHHDLSKPFATFAPDHGEDCTDHLTEKPFEYKPYNHETLAALATLLLEIELGKRIEQLQVDEDVGGCDFDTKFWTTSRVLKEEEDNMYQSCYTAIDACIRCDFEDHPPTLDDPNFLQKVYERIVAPLEQDLWTGFKIRMPFIDAFNDKPEEDTANLSPSSSPNSKTASKTYKAKKRVTMFDSPHLDEAEEEEDVFNGEFADVSVSPHQSGISAVVT